MTGTKPSAGGRLLERVKRYIADNRGVSTVEYALIVVGVVAIVGSGVAVLGGAFDNMFNQLQQQIDNTQTQLST